MVTKFQNIALFKTPFCLKRLIRRFWGHLLSKMVQNRPFLTVKSQFLKKWPPKHRLHQRIEFFNYVILKDRGLNRFSQRISVKKFFWVSQKFFFKILPKILPKLILFVLFIFCTFKDLIGFKIWHWRSQFSKR